MLEKNINVFWQGGTPSEKHMRRFSQWKAKNPDFTIKFWINPKLLSEEQHSEMIIFARKSKLELCDIHDYSSKYPEIFNWINELIEEGSKGGRVICHSAISDVLRFIFLKEEGGFWFDTDIEPRELTETVMSPKHGFYVHVELDAKRKLVNSTYSPAIVACKKGSPFAEVAIRLAQSFASKLEHKNVFTEYLTSNKFMLHRDAVINSLASIGLVDNWNRCIINGAPLAYRELSTGDTIFSSDMEDVCFPLKYFKDNKEKTWYAQLDHRSDELCTFAKKLLEDKRQGGEIIDMIFFKSISAPQETPGDVQLLIDTYNQFLSINNSTISCIKTVKPINFVYGEQQTLRESKQDNLDLLPDILLDSEGSDSVSRVFSVGVEAKALEPTSPTDPRSPLNVSILQQAAQSFDRWMDDFGPDGIYDDYDDSNQALVNWIGCGGDNASVEYIQTYKQLCQLAEYLQQHYPYQTTNPPCTPEIFEQEYSRRMQRPSDRADTSSSAVSEAARGVACGEYYGELKQIPREHNASVSYFNLFAPRTANPPQSILDESFSLSQPSSNLSAPFRGLKSRGADVARIITGFFLGKHINQAEQYIIQYGDADNVLETVVECCLELFEQQEERLYILSHISDKSVRESLANEIGTWEYLTDVAQSDLKTANEISSLMKNHNLDYEQARAKRESDITTRTQLSQSNLPDMAQKETARVLLQGCSSSLFAQQPSPNPELKETDGQPVYEDTASNENSSRCVIL